MSVHVHIHHVPARKSRDAGGTPQFRKAVNESFQARTVGKFDGGDIREQNSPAGGKEYFLDYPDGLIKGPYGSIAHLKARAANDASNVTGGETEARQQAAELRRQIEEARKSDTGKRRLVGLMEKLRNLKFKYGAQIAMDAITLGKEYQIKGTAGTFVRVTSHVRPEDRQSGTYNAIVTRKTPDERMYHVGEKVSIEYHEMVGDAARDALNHLGEREYQTYGAWRTAAKAAGAVRFEGDKDIASAIGSDGVHVGEWGGDKGSIYKKRTGDRSFKDATYYVYIPEEGDWEIPGDHTSVQSAREAALKMFRKLNGPKYFLPGGARIWKGNPDEFNKDAGKFDESKHPRGKGGEFGKGGTTRTKSGGAPVDLTESFAKAKEKTDKQKAAGTFKPAKNTKEELKYARRGYGSKFDAALPWKEGDRYYIAKPTNKEGFASQTYVNNEYHKNLVKRGLLFRTKEEAQKAAGFKADDHRTRDMTIPAYIKSTAARMSVQPTEADMQHYAKHLQWRTPELEAAWKAAVKGTKDRKYAGGPFKSLQLAVNDAAFHGHTGVTVLVRKRSDGIHWKLAP